MHISVAGKQIDLSDALKYRVTDHLDRISEKYFGQAMEARVTFSRARSFFTCDINLHASRGLTLRGEGEAADAHGAFDDAAEHIAKRLRRYHRKATNHGHLRSRTVPTEMGRSYVLRPGGTSPRVRMGVRRPPPMAWTRIRTLRWVGQVRMPPSSPSARPTSQR